MISVQLSPNYETPTHPREDGPEPAGGPEAHLDRRPAKRPHLGSAEIIIMTIAVIVLVLFSTFAYALITLLHSLPEGEGHPATILFERTNITSSIKNNSRYWDLEFTITEASRLREDLNWSALQVVVNRFVESGRYVHLRLENSTRIPQNTTAPMASFEDRSGDPTVPDKGDRFSVINADRTFQGGSVILSPVSKRFESRPYHAQYVPLGIWDERYALDLSIAGIETVINRFNQTMCTLRLAVGNVTPGPEAVPWTQVGLFILWPSNSTDEVPGVWHDYPLVTELWGNWTWYSWHVENGPDEEYISPGDIIVVENLCPDSQLGEGHLGAFLILMTGTVALGHIRFPVHYS